MTLHQIGIKAHGLMADQNLKGILGSKHKNYSHGSSSSRSTKQKCLIDLEILAQHLQRCLRLYEDCMSMENLMECIGKYKIKVEKSYFYEQILRLSQL